MWSVVTACLLAIAPAEVTVSPLQGTAVRGTLVELSEKGVAVQSASGPVQWGANAVHTVRFGSAGSAVRIPASSVIVELIDDSVINAMGFVSVTGTASMELAEGARRTVPADTIRTVRFHKQDDSMRKQWNELNVVTTGGDILVMRKSNQPTADKKESLIWVLDQVEGIVHEVKPDKVVFEYDGNRVDVPRAKVEGVHFRQRSGVQLPDPACSVKGVSGDIWNVRSMQLRDGKLQLVTVAGAQGEIPISRLAEIDFSAANLVYLSDLEFESMDWRPYFRSAATPGSLAKWFEPKRDRGSDGLPLVLQGQSYDKGLALHSRTQLSYRLTKPYRRFHATVGIEDRHRATGNLRLVITGDDRALVDRTITGVDEPFDIDLEVEGVRRIKILVDFGDDRSDAGDLLYVCNARLTK